MEAIQAELEDELKLMGATARAKLSGLLPKDYDIRGGSIIQNESWRIGYGRCLAEVHRIMEKLTTPKEKQQ